MEAGVCGNVAYVVKGVPGCGEQGSSTGGLEVVSYM